MIRHLANERVIDLMDYFGTRNNAELSVEFFFYADKQDDASNLAIELNKLQYEIYDVGEPLTAKDKWSVIGATPKMCVADESMNSWTDQMEKLAEENNCVFDGWGTLIDPNEN